MGEDQSNSQEIQPHVELIAFATLRRLQPVILCQHWQSHSVNPKLHTRAEALLW